MKIFLDTAAFLALINDTDQYNLPAKQAWEGILSIDAHLVSSNYILLETTTLLQNHFGMEAVRIFYNNIVASLDIAWVDASIHLQSMRALLVANRRQLSLTDCTSFEIMRQWGIDTIFTFDPHFREQGFSILPSGGEAV